MPLYFNAAQMPMTNKAFNDAEKLVAQQFRLSEQDVKNNKYEVKTLAYLNEQEIKDGAFAHLCKYTFEKADTSEGKSRGAFDFYRICLQDNTILNAVERANSFIKFSPLMLYIAVHELIHVLRFSTGDIDFHAGEDEKEKEEIIVHSLTKTTLQPVKGYDVDMVLDCFSNNFRNFDIFN